MRSESIMKKLILDFAKNDERIRAVLLNGSRANKKIIPDLLQDFDIVFVVKDFKTFIEEHDWTNKFGKKLIQQFPGEMFTDKSASEERSDYSHLMIFEDGNRIDLTIFPLEKVTSDFESDSLTVVWLDKDNLFSRIPPPDDTDYHIKTPSQKDFSDTCNEFWWVCTNVAKALARGEIILAKEVMETIVRPMFMKMIAWEIGWQNNFAVSFGKGGKSIRKYLDTESYNRILNTYAAAGIDENWESLFKMCHLFEQFSCQVAIALQFDHEKKEEQNTLLYLKKIYEDYRPHREPFNPGLEGPT